MLITEITSLIGEMSPLSRDKIEVVVSLDDIRCALDSQVREMIQAIDSIHITCNVHIDLHDVFREHIMDVEGFLIADTFAHLNSFIYNLIDKPNININYQGSVQLFFEDVETADLKEKSDKCINAIVAIYRNIGKTLSNRELVLHSCISQIDRAYEKKEGLSKPNLSSLIKQLKNKKLAKTMIELGRRYKIFTSNREFIKAYISIINPNKDESEVLTVVDKELFSISDRVPVYIIKGLSLEEQLILSRKYSDKIDIEIYSHQLKDMDMNIAEKVVLEVFRVKKESGFDFDVQIELIHSLSKDGVIELLLISPNTEILAKVLHALTIPAGFSRISSEDCLELLVKIYSTYPVVRKQLRAIVCEIVYGFCLTMQDLEDRYIRYRKSRIEADLSAGIEVVYELPEDLSLGHYKEIIDYSKDENFLVKVNINSTLWSSYLSSRLDVIDGVVTVLLAKYFASGGSLEKTSDSNAIYGIKLLQNIINHLILEHEVIDGSIAAQNSQKEVITYLLLYGGQQVHSSVFRFIKKFGPYFFKDEEVSELGEELVDKLRGFNIDLIADQFSTESVINLPKDISGFPLSDATEALKRVSVTFSWSFSYACWQRYTDYTPEQVISLCFAVDGTALDLEKNKSNISMDQNLSVAFMFYAMKKLHTIDEVKELFIKSKGYLGWSESELQSFLLLALKENKLFFSDIEIVNVIVDLGLSDSVLSWYKHEKAKENEKFLDEMCRDNKMLKIPKHIRFLGLESSLDQVKKFEDIEIDFNASAWLTCSYKLKAEEVCLSVFLKLAKSGKPLKIDNMFGPDKVFSSFRKALQLIHKIGDPLILKQSISWAIKIENMMPWAKIRKIIEATLNYPGYFPIFLLNGVTNPCVNKKYIKEKFSLMLSNNKIYFPDSFIGLNKNEILEFVSRYCDETKVVINAESAYSNVVEMSVVEFKRAIEDTPIRPDNIDFCPLYTKEIDEDCRELSRADDDSSASARQLSLTNFRHVR